MWAPHWPGRDWHCVGPGETRHLMWGARCLVTAGPLIMLIISSLHHSSQRDKSLTVTTQRPLMGHYLQLKTSDWWITHFAGLPFADLLHRWSVNPDEKLSHHLHSSSRTPAPQFVVWSIGAHSSFNIPNSHAHWDWIKMPNKIRFSGVIDIFCPHVLTMSRLLPIFN